MIEFHKLDFIPINELLNKVKLEQWNDHLVEPDDVGLQ